MHLYTLLYIRLLIQMGFIRSELMRNMKAGATNNVLLLLLFSLLSSGFSVYALSYDYDFNPECVKIPPKPQYGGGIVVNPELEDGLKGWTTFGSAKLKTISKDGKNHIAALDRQSPYDSFSQQFDLHKEMFYTFSAWLQVGQGQANVAATFKTLTDFVSAGTVTAQSGCWSMLKGGLTVNVSGPAVLYFESHDTSVDILAQSISLQPFTQEEWRSHQDQSIEKVRKRNVKLHVIDGQGKALANATIEINQLKPHFPLGCAMNFRILTNPGFANWFTSRFKLTTFENEMKWYSTEHSAGHENYSVPDALLQFAENHGISVRGHTVLWDDPRYNDEWVKLLSPSELSVATNRRLNSVMTRYRGKVIHWDVVNENLHFSFLESKLGQNASAVFYSKARQLDQRATLFLNEYNTIESERDEASTPTKYLEKIRDLGTMGYKGPLAIGLEGHFKTPNIPYIRAAIDQLAAARSPIWLTELDVRNGPSQATYLDQILREAHAHPAVNGIVMWASWKPAGCYQMCLTDNNFKNLPTGDVVDKILWEWSHKDLASVTTDDHGYFETSLFLGDYEVKISHNGEFGGNSSKSHTFSVTPAAGKSPETLYVEVSE